jgi:hypothetical protein
LRHSVGAFVVIASSQSHTILSKPESRVIEQNSAGEFTKGAQNHVSYREEFHRCFLGISKEKEAHRNFAGKNQ